MANIVELVHAATGADTPTFLGMRVAELVLVQVGSITVRG